MTPVPTAALVSILMASAVVALVLGVRPRRRTVAEVRSILQPSNGLGDRARGIGHPRTNPLGSSVGGPVSAPRRLAHTGAEPIVAPIRRAIERSVGDGLLLVRRSAHEAATRIVLAAVGLAFVTLCLLGSAIAVGVLPASPWWFLLVGVAALAGAWVMWSDLRSTIARRRREFRRTTTDFIQLVAVGLTTDQSVEEAVQFALGVGDSDLFDLLRDELATAPMRGVPLWEAIDQLGRTCHQRELCEFAGSIERQGTQGVSITETVNSLATAMRAKALDELEREADRANANLSGPTIGFVVATMVFLAYPLAVRIGEAFGG
ncbi:MAG: hypothetical protein NTZ21_07995 [Actinobacteria bacterium]|nr:hypothetical protein [Actinomycetota bacterium]